MTRGESTKDGNQFDSLTRSISAGRSRREFAGLLGGLGLLSAFRGEKIAAHNPLSACRKIKDRTKRQRCIKRAKAHNAKHRNCPCAGGICDGDKTCVCPAESYQCSPERCCANEQACLDGRSRCGACILGASACDNLLCGITSLEQPCVCASSFQGTACISDLVCHDCASDSDCDDAPGLPAGERICISVVGCACNTTTGMACSVKGCFDWP